ncbi:hypothetical protein NHF46_00945 [Arthrobacter alpinus]|nr:hypothetical protein [Arthrobacter alpinus]
MEARASDLNPVAVLINKALIELPYQFRDQSPVFPGVVESEIGDWTGARGLISDIRSYGGGFGPALRAKSENFIPMLTGTG